MAGQKKRAECGTMHHGARWYWSLWHGGSLEHSETLHARISQVCLCYSYEHLVRRDPRNPKARGEQRRLRAPAGTGRPSRRIFTRLSRSYQIRIEVCQWNQAAAPFGVTGFCLPSTTWMPAETSSSNSGVFRRRNRASATCNTCQINAVADSTPLSRLPAVVRSRTAAEGDSTPLVVRGCCQCFCRN